MQGRGPLGTERLRSDMSLAAHALPVEPARLAPRARIALVAPSGPLGHAGKVARAVETAASLGREAVAGAHALWRRHHLF